MTQFLCKPVALPAAIIILLTVVFFWFYDPYKPLHQVPPPSSLTDDLDRASLIAVMEQQKHYLERLPQDKTVAFESYQISNSWLLHSLNDLLAYIQQQPSQKDLEQFLLENYVFFQAGGRTSNWSRQMLVTGYYEPLFKGSLSRKAPYLSPLYRRPISLTQKVDSNGNKQVGRYDEKDSFTTFWTRQEIETKHHLDGDEIVYLEDPFDAYLLHVQGSGKIALPDGSVRSIGFAGTNGLEYISIGKYLVDHNIMKLKDVTIPAIRQYLRENPSELTPLLHQNPRYIFFQWGDNKGPRGSSGVPLTPGRSIAIDSQSLPTGTIAYLLTEKPKLNSKLEITSWQPMHRLVFPQDSGSAIKGSGRVDVFWGNGSYAEIAANHMKHPGKLYFLVKKGFPQPQK